MLFIINTKNERFGENDSYLCGVIFGDHKQWMN